MTCVSNRDTDPPIQKLLHTVGMLCIDYYAACQRKKRANRWNDCHPRVDRPRQQAQKKNLLGFRARTFRISNLASGRGGPRYCGGQQSGLKKRLSSPTPGIAGLAAGSHARRPAPNGIREFRKTMPRPRRGSELVFGGPRAAKSSCRCHHTHPTT